MHYPAAALGAGIGMMATLVIFSIARRTAFIPQSYDFIHDFGRSLVCIDNKKLTYLSRFAVGIIFHPLLFVFVWGRDGWLHIDPANSAVLSAVILLAIESLLFSFVLWSGVLAMPPREFVGKVILLQLVSHVLLGVLMGLSYEILT